MAEQIGTSSKITLVYITAGRENAKVIESDVVTITLFYNLCMTKENRSCLMQCCKSYQ